MFDPARPATNLSQQLIYRENNFKLHGEPRLFASHLYRERMRLAKNLYKTDLKGHFGCVNAIEFSHGGQFLASGGDDKRVLVWDIEKSLSGPANPRTLETEQSSNIFCLGFDSQNRKLISGGNDALAISHDFETGKLDNIFKHEEPVYGLSIDPQNDNIFATASENGVVLLFDQRTDSADPLVVASLSSSFHAVEFHPYMSHLLVTANSKRGAALYDTRKPKEPVIEYVSLGNLRSCMSVRFNKTGNLILGLRRRLTPILYSINSPDRICTFYHSYYYNSCTMKSCTFAGEDDELVISGSDDFNLYVWRLSDIDFDAIEQWVETTQMVLYGHRSIVNQVRYNREKCLLASSGVEKIVKLWSPFSQHNWSGFLTEKATCSDNPRELYSPFNLFTMALPGNWHHLSHDYSSENTNEDPRMMAFFDSLIQQEIEGWDSDINASENSQNADGEIASSIYGSCENSSHSCDSSSFRDSSHSSSSSSDSSSGSDSDNENKYKTNVRKNKRAAYHAKRKAKQRQLKVRTQKHNEKSPKNSQKDVHTTQIPTNRIAYLIAKKRKTLRRLAIKGSSLGNRRSHKMIVVTNGRAKRTKLRSTVDTSIPHSFISNNSGSNSDSFNKPSTSKAAEASSVSSESSSCHASGNIGEHAKTNSDLIYTSSEDTENFVAGGYISSSSNNANIPSTSTGITSNFRDAFLRLSRQIYMSDSEDDSDGGNTNHQNGKSGKSAAMESGSSPKKINGANKERASTIREDIHSDTVMSETCDYYPERSIRTNRQSPKTSAALYVGNAIKTELPHENAPIIILQSDSDTDFSSSSRSSSRSSTASDTSSLENDILNESPSNTKNTKKRTSEEYSLSQAVQYSPRYSSNPSDDERITSSPSQSTSLPALSSVTSVREEEQAHYNIFTSFSTSLPKKRKISINDYIQIRNTADLQDLEENNNETNNNDIFATENYNVNTNGQATPQRSLMSNNTFASYLNGNNNHDYLFTPDSGVSLNSSLATPSVEGHNDSLGASTSHSSRVISQLSPRYENDGIINDAALVHNNSSIYFNGHQNKLARVRRNYRKQFFNDTDSD